MNPGYLSFTIIVIVLILLASGWKEVLFKGIRHTIIVLFIFLWFLSIFMKTNIFGINMYMDFILVLLISLWGMMKQDEYVHKFLFILIAMLLGALQVLLQEWELFHPSMLLQKILFDQHLLISLLVLFTIKKPITQISLISLSFIFSNLLNFSIQMNHTSIVLGNLAFQDEWWISVIAARVGTVLFERLQAVFFVLIHLVLRQKKG